MCECMQRGCSYWDSLKRKQTMMKMMFLTTPRSHRVLLVETEVVANSNPVVDVDLLSVWQRHQKKRQTFHERIVAVAVAVADDSRCSSSASASWQASWEMTTTRTMMAQSRFEETRLRLSWCSTGSSSERAAAAGRSAGDERSGAETCLKCCCCYYCYCYFWRLKPSPSSQLLLYCLVARCCWSSYSGCYYSCCFDFSVVVAAALEQPLRGMVEDWFSDSCGCRRRLFSWDLSLEQMIDEWTFVAVADSDPRK